jgi:hypothetical protein
MQAMLLVQDGFIVRSGVAIKVTISPFAKGVTWRGSTSLITSVRSQASLGTPERWEEKQRSRHPDYTEWAPGGCSFCVMERVTYADSISSEEAAKLSDFQLSCATRWSSCLTLEELNPAVHVHKHEPAKGDAPENNTFQRGPISCAIPLYALGRDADRIVEVEALEDGLSLGKDCDGIEHESSRVRVLGPLKRDSPWATSSIHKVLTANTYFIGRRPPHLVKARHYLLVLDKYDHGAQDDVSLERCGIIGG